MVKKAKIALTWYWHDSQSIRIKCFVSYRPAAPFLNEKI